MQHERMHANGLVRILACSQPASLPHSRKIKIRYTVMGVPVSAWLNSKAGFGFDLRMDNPALAMLKDGVLDVSLEVRSLPEGMHAHSLLTHMQPAAMPGLQLAIALAARFICKSARWGLSR